MLYIAPNTPNIYLQICYASKASFAIHSIFPISNRNFSLSSFIEEIKGIWIIEEQIKMIGMQGED